MATFGGFPGFGTPSTPAPLWPPATPSAATPAWSATPSTPAVSSALFSTTPAVQNQPPPIMGGSAATATATRLAWGMKFSDFPPQYADVLVKIQDQIFASRAHTWDTRTVNALDKVSAENRAVMERTKPLKEAIDSDRLRVTNLSNQILEKRRLLDQARITIHSMQSSSFHSDELRPDPFFLQLANELETRICQCELQLKEIDDIFKASAAATGTASNLHTLLSDNYKLLLAIGKQVASTHEEVERLRAAFLEYYRKTSPTLADPFNSVHNTQQPLQQRVVSQPQQPYAQSQPTYSVAPQVQPTPGAFQPPATPPSFLLTPSATPSATAPSFFGPTPTTVNSGSSTKRRLS